MNDVMQNPNSTVTSTSETFTSRANVIFIGGFLDRFSHLVMNYSEYFRCAYPEYDTFYFEHDQRRQVVAAVAAIKAAAPTAPVTLVGHSWGAVTAVKAANELARQGIEVEQLVTIDPVSRKRVSVLAKATAWVNVNAAPATSNGWNGDYYAALGGKWGDWPRGRAAVHYWAPCHHNEFTGLVEYVSLHGQCALDCLAGSRKAESHS